jgi:sugar phosphate isomerase/epimerase
MEKSRRRFFKNAGAGALGLTISSSLFSRNLSAIDKATTANDKAGDLFQVAIAGWTFVKFKLEPSLEMMDRVNVRNLCIKSYHLAIDSTPEQIAAFWDQLKAKGITGYGVGPIYMKSEKEVDDAFEYAKRVGVKLIVGVPEHELLPYVNRKVKEYDFHYAIHNHGLEDKRYPTVESIYERIKDLDTRLGICHDIGYSIQMGFDPAAVTLKYGHRVYEMHVKDMVNAAGTWTDCEIGRGAIDFAALVKALRKTKYSGMCSIENEKNNKDPLPGLAESVGYLKAVIKLT